MANSVAANNIKLLIFTELALLQRFVLQQQIKIFTDETVVDMQAACVHEVSLVP